MDIAAANWNEDDNANTTAAPDGAPEGMAPSGVNNVLRAHQGAMKRFYNWTIPKITGGSGTAYTLSYTVAPGALVDGMTHLVQFHAVNGAGATLNVNGLGAIPLHFYCCGSWAALPANMLAVDQIVRCVYNSSAGAYRCIALPLVLTQSVSGAAAIDFTSIPSNVNHIACEFEVKPNTDGAVIGIRTYGADGVRDSGASDYAWWDLNFSTAGSSPSVVADDSADGITLTGTVDNGVTGVSGSFHAENIQAATYTKFSGETNYLESTGTSGVGIVVRGQRMEADRITGIRVYPSAGTITGRTILRFLG